MVVTVDELGDREAGHIWDGEFGSGRAWRLGKGGTGLADIIRVRCRVLVVTLGDRVQILVIIIVQQTERRFRVIVDGFVVNKL